MHGFIFSTVAKCQSPVAVTVAIIITYPPKGGLGPFGINHERLYLVWKQCTKREKERRAKRNDCRQVEEQKGAKMCPEHESLSVIQK